MPNNLLFDHYHSIQDRYPVREEPVYGTLVAPNGNASAPCHRWFQIKEGFSSQLLERVLSDTGLDSSHVLSVLDPFSGSGTTLASAVLWAGEGNRSVTALGVERNPFLHLVAQTKLRALTEDDVTFTVFAERVLDLLRRKAVQPAPTPALSTFSNVAYFEPHVLRALLEVRSAIDATEGTSLQRDLALVSLAATIEPASRLRRDGRALRYEPSKASVDPITEFERRCRIVAEDLARPRVQAIARVYRGDGRLVQNVLPDGYEADLVLFSPPYPNNIDYTEVYKLEAWLLNFINDQEGFRQLRLRTLRSHASCMFPEDYGASVNGFKAQFDELITPLLSSVPVDEDRRWRMRLIRGYFDDMLETLKNLRGFTSPRGRVVYVTGNSLHGSKGKTFLIAADLLIARLGEMAGYEVERIAVARRPIRRSSIPLLRESIVFLRPA
jgi:SAM-dependent methyltransferase